MNSNSLREEVQVDWVEVGENFWGDRNILFCQGLGLHMCQHLPKFCEWYVKRLLHCTICKFLP